MAKQLEALIARAKHIVENGGLLARDTSLQLIAALEQSLQQDELALKTIANLTELWSEGRNRIAELEEIKICLLSALENHENFWALREMELSSLSPEAAMVRDVGQRAITKANAAPSPMKASPLAVKLHKRSVGEVMHMSGFSRDYAEGWCAGNDNAIHEIRAAGGTVCEGE